MRLVDRIRLRRAALRYAAHDWAVAPGSYRTGERIEAWEDEASTDVARVALWWRHLPHPVLLATGRTFDVLEVTAAVGLRALGAARLHSGVIGPGLIGPVAVTPAGRWMFFVRPDEELRPELASCLDVRHHGRGSWVPAAPSPTPQGRVRWVVPPEQHGWRLPAAAAVQVILLDAIGPRPARTSVPSVPRQMSTSRRAA
ncbi:bifunctional DNA primase/polymerase [Actinoplanes sp. NPDC051494]|uniref:bifunctional DNA primase/polymerase n=1 Tax=Actinoplanes sp. NPDC051494 TaxID=3363907 RepID=UPI0037A02C2B